jgi:nucleoside-diphosphate-sugar epimerase
MKMSNYLVVGAGPVGSTIAMTLAQAGHTVRVLTRSGNGPQRPNIALLKGDASNIAFATSEAFAASAIFNCANPPYHQWTGRRFIDRYSPLRNPRVLYSP